MKRTTVDAVNSDPALNLLFQVFNETHGKTDECLWICDENILDYAQQLDARAEYITNRFDVAESLRNKNLNVSFNDFNFDHITPKTLQSIFYRISKEKSVVHHVIKQAHKYLAADGSLYIAGLKNEGTKTYLDKAAVFFSSEKTTKKKGLVYWAKYTKVCEERTIIDAQVLDDKRYAELRSITVKPNETFDFFSKPGIFGWQQIDAGSEFLIDTLEAKNAVLALSPNSLLDLGCGYGYLAIKTALTLLNNTPKVITLTDNNAAAINAAKYNCMTHKVAADVIAADAGNNINHTFEMIICNPPFHQGFTIDNALTDKFIRAAARLLTNDGQAFFVVNSFIALEKHTISIFNRCEKIASNGRFSVYRMHAPMSPSHR